MSAHDDKIKVLLEKVEEQKAGLGTKPKASWETNGIFKYTDGSYFNINTVKDPQRLVNALALLLEKESLQGQAAERLGVEAQSLDWNGFPVSDWEADFKKRIDIVKWQERKKQLEATKKKLKSLVSDEGKTEMALADIEKMLSL
jgi:hypothetical protein